MIRQCRGLLVLALFAISTMVSANETTTELAPTHKQVKVFQPKRDGKTGQLHTFCLTCEGNILASVTAGANVLQLYTPELTLVKEIELPFAATALNVAPNGTIYAGGSGKVALISAIGEVQGVQRSPQLADEKTIKERMVKAAKDKAEKVKETYRKQIETITARIAKMEESKEELSERDQKRMETYLRQKEMMEDNLKKYEETAEIDPEKIMTSGSGVRAIAATEDAVFVACNSLEGYGYEVWKAKPDLSEPSLILTGLSGCCGQFDLQANKEFLVLAENTKFQVGLLDHEGKRLSSFGKSNRMGGDGFGSCCNPMNVRCCENGDILTAESSIGTIKRFNASGDLVGVIGKAKIGGGCKHVALGFDQTRNRYYLQYQDKNAICVLVPNAEAPDMTEDEMLAKKAREGFGKTLVGKWTVGNKGKKSNSGLFSALGATVGGGQPADPFLSNEIEFKADGKMIGITPDLKWEAIRQDEKSLMVNMEMEEVGYDLKIVFDGDDKCTVSVMLGGDQPYSTRSYTRFTEESKEKSEAKSEDKTGGQ